jgi:predicted CxxxxCH...CXXCH cytochrome family protein
MREVRPMRIKAKNIIIVGVIIAITFLWAPYWVKGAVASMNMMNLDAPHNASNNISCGTCHKSIPKCCGCYKTPYTPENIDDTVYNRLCLSCHEASSGPYSETNAPLEKTHSSLTTSNKYGDWTVECRVCHNPHQQKQKVYKDTDASNLYLATGTIQSCVYNGGTPGTSTLTYSVITYKSGWDAAKLTDKTGVAEFSPNDARTAILFPDVNNMDYSYPLIAIDTVAKTITVKGNATGRYLHLPTTFAMLYGQYIYDDIEYGDIYKTVNFFDKEGANSFADGDGTYDGICEVCHTQTEHFRNNGGAPDQNHTNIREGGVGGTNCVDCHPHTEGFKGMGCDACHGNPPPPLADMPRPTGSETAGAHVFHATTVGYKCSICHYNSAGFGPTHKNGKITLGFVNMLGLYTGGIYDGQTTADYQSSDPGTSVSNTGLKECSNMYCHGSTMAPNGGINITPVWDDPTTAVCGTCHGASIASPPLRGSHPKHAGSASGGKQFACTVCHSNYTVVHVNGSADWAFDTAITWLSGALYKGSATGSASPVPSSIYGTCSNLYCHSIVQTATGGPLTGLSGEYKTPTWGGAAMTCTSCHGNPSASGSHTEHVATYSYDCAQCHSGQVPPGVSTHVNGAIDTAINVSWSGTYNGDTIPGTGFSNCSDTYCHSKGTGGTSNPGETRGVSANTSPNWGGSTTCGSCHGEGGDSGKPTYANGSLKANSHAKHGMTCEKCHYSTTTTGNTVTDYTKHVNKLYEVNNSAGTITYTYTATGGTCSALPCHGSAQWGGPPIPMDDCKSCHNAPQGSRRQIVADAAGTGGDFIKGSGHVPPTVTPGGPGGTTTIVYSPSATAVGPWGDPAYGGDGPFMNPTDAYTSNNVYAYSPYYYGYYYSSMYFNYGISVPSGATISKVEIGYEAYTVGGGTLMIRASGNGGSSWSYWYADGSSTYVPPYGCGWGNLATTPGSETVRYFACGTNRATSPWSFTAAQLTDANFRVEVRVGGSDESVTYFDWFPVRVTYTQPGGPPTTTENVTNADCIVCHDQSQHMGGVVRLKDADTGAVYNYDPANPSSIENYCLSCHDANGKNGNMKPFSDLKELGVVPYKMSKDIKTYWTKTYGHQALAAGKRLTCLGGGTAGIGCHGSGSAINGHGSVNKGLLAKNLTLPNSKTGPYVTAYESDYEICFSCHANYPGVRKEDVLGVKQGGKYDNNHGWSGYLPPYYIPSITTKFRNRFDGSGKFYDDTMWGTRYNLHWFHVQNGGWNYRDSIASNINCISCHNVHGSDTQYGWVYDEIGYIHGIVGSDQYGQPNNYTQLGNGVYPMSCTTNCHINAGLTHNWFEPPDE